MAEELSKIKVAESEEFTMPVELEEGEQLLHSNQDSIVVKMLPGQAFAKRVGLRSSKKKGHFPFFAIALACKAWQANFFQLLNFCN